MSSIVHGTHGHNAGRCGACDRNGTCGAHDKGGGGGATCDQGWLGCHGPISPILDVGVSCMSIVARCTTDHMGTGLDGDNGYVLGLMARVHLVGGCSGHTSKSLLVWVQ